MKTIITTIILLISSSSVFSQNSKFTYQDNVSEFDAKVQESINENEPGFAIILIEDGEIIFSKSTGLANREEKIPITLDTPFNIASISKTFTAAAILKLKEEGRIKLEDMANKYLTELPDYTDGIRVYHLLTHTSGLQDYERDIEFAGTNEAVLTHIDEADSLNFEPHTNYSYSNVAYVLLAEIIEKVSGQDYEDYLDEAFFTPLNMENTFVAGSERVNSKSRAIGYHFDEEKLSYVVNDSKNDLVYGSTGIYSSVTDLAKWYEALKEFKVISGSSLNLMYDYPTTTSGKISWMAMGWFNETVGRHTPELEGLRKRGAIGVTFGFRGMMEMYEFHDFGYIALTNKGEMPAFIGGELAKIFFK